MEVDNIDDSSTVDSLGSDIECEGIGNVVFTDSKSRQFYQSCQLNDLTITIGDCARVTIEKKHNHDEDAFGFAQVLAIYEDIEHEVFVEVRWFEIPSELKKPERALLNFLGEDELIETDTVDDIPAGAIVEVIAIAGTNTEQFRSTQSIQYTCRYWKNQGTIHEVSPRTIYLRGYNVSEYKEAYPMATQNHGIDDNDPYTLAIQKLHLSAVPESLPCREEETNQVDMFLRNRMARRSDAGTGPMLLCGMPGTGKTASVLSTIKALRKEVEAGSLADFNFTEINCLHLKQPMEAYAQLWRGISGHHLSSHSAFHKLKHYFDPNLTVSSTAHHEEQKALVCLVDELDFLLTKDMRVLFSFLDWSRSNGQRSFIMIGVANTLNLMEQVKARRIASRATVEYNRLNFSPYNHDQIHQIIGHRLSELTVPGLPSNFIMLLARKAATVAGDMRSALKICKATLLAWKPHGLLVSETAKASAQVFAHIINEAIESYRRSPFISGIAALSQLEIAILICFSEERRNVCGDERGSSAASLTAAMLLEHLASLLHKIEQQKRALHENAMKIHLILPPSYLVTKALDRLLEKGILRSRTTHLKCGKPMVLYFLNLMVHNVDVVAGLRGTPWESFFS